MTLLLVILAVIVVNVVFGVLIGKFIHFGNPTIG